MIYGEKSMIICVLPAYRRANLNVGHVGISIFLFIALLLICGCTMTGMTGIKPISPPLSTHLGGNEFVTTVDSLQPEFIWEPVSGDGTSYDLMITESPNNFGQPGWGSFERKRAPICGDSIYYETNIKEDHHKITKPLKPHSCYCWSVRIRRGDLVGKWSKYNFNTVFGGYSEEGRNIPFTFKTPEK